MTQFDGVSVVKKANVYFGGKCVSHTVLLDGGVKKSVGVILPSTLTFNTGAPEVMELLEGRCRVKFPGEKSALEFRAGQSFKAPGQSSFEIETLETLHYVCHFG